MPEFIIPRPAFVVIEGMPAVKRLNLKALFIIAGLVFICFVAIILLAALALSRY